MQECQACDGDTLKKVKKKLKNCVTAKAVFLGISLLAVKRFLVVIKNYYLKYDGIMTTF